MRRVGTKRNDNFYFIFFSSFSNLFLALNEAIMEFLNFLNFFAIFLEFSILRRVWTDRNENFYFVSFSAFSNLFWLKMISKLYFWIILLFFWNFLLRVRKERNRTKRQFLFSLFRCVFQPILASKEAIMVFLNFLNFFAIFFGILYYASCKNWTEW